MTREGALNLAKAKAESIENLKKQVDELRLENVELKKSNSELRKENEKLKKESFRHECGFCIYNDHICTEK